MNQKTGGEKPFILVAEDHVVNQNLYSLILTKLGYDYILANDGADALEKAQEREPDLVFMDIQMPKINGYEAAKILRGRGYKKAIIAVTASTLQDEFENCKNAGMNDVLIKPFKLTDIKAILQNFAILKQEVKEEPVPLTSKKASKPDYIFDAAGMLDTFMNNEKAALPLLSRFIERTRGQLEKFPALKEADNWESARREAHTIRGAALTMGGTELGNAAGCLEQACVNADKAAVDAAFPSVCEAFANFKREAESYILSREPG